MNIIARMLKSGKGGRRLKGWGEPRDVDIIIHGSRDVETLAYRAELSFNEDGGERDYDASASVKLMLDAASLAQVVAMLTRIHQYNTGERCGCGHLFTERPAHMFSDCESKHSKAGVK